MQKQVALLWATPLMWAKRTKSPSHEKALGATEADWWPTGYHGSHSGLCCHVWHLWLSDLRSLKETLENQWESDWLDYYWSGPKTWPQDKKALHMKYQTCFMYSVSSVISDVVVPYRRKFPSLPRSSLKMCCVTTRVVVIIRIWEYSVYKDQRAVIK